MVRRRFSEHRMPEQSNNRDRVCILRHTPGTKRVRYSQNGAQTSVLLCQLHVDIGVHVRQSKFVQHRHGLDLQPRPMRWTQQGLVYSMAMHLNVFHLSRTLCHIYGFFSLSLTNKNYFGIQLSLKKYKFLTCLFFKLIYSFNKELMVDF